MNSASAVDIVTIDCFVLFQTIGQGSRQSNLPSTSGFQYIPAPLPDRYHTSPKRSTHREGVGVGLYSLRTKYGIIQDHLRLYRQTNPAALTYHRLYFEVA